MKTRDIQKFLALVHDVVSSALDHVADQLADGADELGDELTDLGKSWKQLTKSARTAFIEQLLKSAALVLATSIATRLGVSIAGKRQKQIRKVMLAVAGTIEPARKAKKLKKKSKKAKAKLKKSLS